MTITFQEACAAVCAPATVSRSEEIDIAGVPTAGTSVHEQLPRNASGKILTRKLRDSVTK